MISVPAGARVLLAMRPVDFRKGAHGLATLASGVLAEDPFSGVVIVYRAKRADRVKILVWDASGLVLIWKQLQQGSFRWPPVMDGVMTLSAVDAALCSMALIGRAFRPCGGFTNRALPHRIRGVMDAARNDIPSLPDDAAALRTLVLTIMAERDALVTERDVLQVQNERLRHLLLQLKRMQFGARSERIEPPRVCRRLQLLRSWSYDEQNDEQILS